MNRDQIKKNLPIFQAFADGKIIQYQNRALGGPWADLKDDANFNFDGYDFRVKPEPKTIYIIRNSIGHVYSQTFDAVAAQAYLAERNKHGRSSPYTLEEYVQVVK